MPLNRGAVTDIGRMRKNNEDRYLSAGRLAAVADGMGGHRAGEVASAIAMEELAAGDAREETAARQEGATARSV